MPLEKEYSVVADSTMSSSPQQEIDALPQIKRPVRTYGRRLQMTPTDDPDTSFSISEPDSTSRDSVHNTAPPGLLEQVPPSSPAAQLSDSATGDTDEEAGFDALPKFEFSWKKKLKDIDLLDDFDKELPSGSQENNAPNQSLFGQPLLLSGNETEDRAAPLGAGDVFGEPLLLGPSLSSPPPQATLSKQAFRLSSPLVGPRVRTRHRVIQDSDSELEPSKNTPSSVPSSASRHLIDTPKSGSSSTQPTSEDDMPAKISKRSAPGRSRNPNSTSRLSVVPLDFTDEPSSDLKRSKDKKVKRVKVKPPTKKDLVETVKERGRLAAQSAVSIPRNDKRLKFTVENLLAKVQGGLSRSQPPSIAREQLVSPSDPIEPFSSSPSSYRSASPEQAPVLSDADDDMPNISEVLQKDTENAWRKNNMKEMKERLVARQQQAAMVSEEDDDDLQIVHSSNAKVTVKEEEDKRKSGNRPRISEGRKRQMRLGKISLAQQGKQAFCPHSPMELGRNDSLRNDTLSILAQRASEAGGLNQTALNRLMVAEARKQAQGLTRKKEEEWQKHGGIVSIREEGNAEGLATVVKTIAENGLKAAEARNANHTTLDEDEDEDGSDEEWNPQMRGSASPEPEEEEDKHDGDAPVDEDITMVDDLETSEGDFNIRAITTRRKIIDSDDENEDDENENDENAPVSARLLPGQYRRSTSSCELPMEDEYDKENNTKLMYDHSEDKENTAVVRHTGAGSSFSVHEMRGGTTLSPGWVGQHPEHDLDEEQNLDRRKPLGNLICDDSPIASQIRPTNLTQSFAAKLQQASPPNTLTPAPSFRPFISAEGNGKSFSEFSQLSDGEPDVFGVAPLLQPGFSDLFESGTEEQKSSLGDRRQVGSSSGRSSSINELKRTDTLDLTQDVIQLQAAFRADDGLLRKADAIFEKEQAFVVEAATDRERTRKPELYINDLGFLTQTRPDVRSPEVYRLPSPSQSLYSLNGQASLLSNSEPRPPLRTLSFTSPTQRDSPEQPLRRLRKHKTPSPKSTQQHSLGSPKPMITRKPNAFDVLVAANAKANRKDEKKRKHQEYSEFFENEAAESDEDDKFGFLKSKMQEDEEDGEDLDKTLDVLMDDKVMDEDTVAADLVHEKYMEQAEEDDKEVEKLHNAAIHGELRTKRKLGVGFDDSDDESENEENGRARRAMKRFRNTDRGDIRDLEANTETRAFAETYNQNLKDDDQDFAYLDSESQLVAIAVDQAPRHYDDQDDLYHEGGEEEVEEEQRFISPAEAKRLVREAAQQGLEEHDGMDVGNVSWIDAADEDDHPRVKAIITRQNPKARSRVFDVSEMDESMGPAFRTTATRMTASNKQWFAQEHKSRNAGNSRSVGGSAVTGHTKSKPKTASGSMSKASLASGQSTSSASSVTSKQVKPAASMLSVIADKSRHFA
ncbi:hypothetical protein B0H34DRAFT_687709 [Crassisporium funariophilum]|nr:hypothetical protein B0H34DRAFT_687709 [Crassisporium funariophilum]